MPSNFRNHRNLDIESLSEQIKADTATFHLEKERLYKLQQANEQDINPADRNVLFNWSRSSITEYNEKLEAMEEIEYPTKEERQVMRELNSLIVLGDQLGDIQTQYLASCGPIKGLMDEEEVSPQAPSRSDGKVYRKKPTGTEQAAPIAVVEHVLNSDPVGQPVPPTAASTIAPPAEALPVTAPSITQQSPPLSGPSPIQQTPVLPQNEMLICADSLQAPEQSQGSDAESPEALMVDDSIEIVHNPDPKGIYAMLGLDPDAPFSEILKRIRKQQLMLHPDRNKSDPDASTKFAEFMALCAETVGTEEKRKAYDQIRTADQLENLTRRVRALTVGSAT